MLKVKIEEKYLKSFEWLLQCYQYLFYYDSGAEVSYNAFRTHQEPGWTRLIPHVFEETWFLTFIANSRFKSSRRMKSMVTYYCCRLINTFPHHLSTLESFSEHRPLHLDTCFWFSLYGWKGAGIFLSIYFEIIWI